MTLKLRDLKVYLKKYILEFGYFCKGIRNVLYLLINISTSVAIIHRLFLMIHMASLNIRHWSQMTTLTINKIPMTEGPRV